MSNVIHKPPLPKAVIPMASDIMLESRFICLTPRILKSCQKWFTTWNDYVHRIMHFLGWLHNKNSSSSSGCLSMENWKTPIFLQIKEKRTKRVSPYLESELCDAMSNTFLITFCG